MSGRLDGVGLVAGDEMEEGADGGNYLQADIRGIRRESRRSSMRKRAMVCSTWVVWRCGRVPWAMMPLWNGERSGAVLPAPGGVGPVLISHHLPRPPSTLNPFLAGVRRLAGPHCNWDKTGSLELYCDSKLDNILNVNQKSTGSRHSLSLDIILEFFTSIFHVPSSPIAAGISNPHCASTC